MKFTDQTALVTGGSRGIGRAIVKVLAAEGAKVALVYRGSKESADSVVKEIADAGGTALALQGDVADPVVAPRCVAAVVEAWGRLDILVNSAGVIRDGLFVRMDADAWNTVLNTNLGGTFAFCRAAVEQMALRQRYGRMINVSSVAADFVNAGQTNYAASKGAVNAFTRALAVEVAGRNVTVNAIAPGFIATDMSEAVRNKAGDFIKKVIPMKRVGQPDEIARVAVFLADPATAYLTGQVITVDGGMSLGATAH
jgi:3-oxoacyl-[acyl-carrier protein] reductase